MEFRQRSPGRSSMQVTMIETANGEEKMRSTHKCVKTYLVRNQVEDPKYSFFRPGLVRPRTPPRPYRW